LLIQYTGIIKHTVVLVLTGKDFSGLQIVMYAVELVLSQKLCKIVTTDCC